MGLVIGIIVAVVVVLLVLWVIGGYNGLVRARNAFKNAFAQIDVQLQRRFDLIPNLVETAKAYMAHERQTLEAVTAGRAAAICRPQRRAGEPGRPGGDAASSRRRRARSPPRSAGSPPSPRQYPDLKASQNMMQLTRGTDLHREQGRLRPAGLQRLGDDVQQPAPELPGSVIAGMFHFDAAAQWEIGAGAPRGPGRAEGAVLTAPSADELLRTAARRPRHHGAAGAAVHHSPCSRSSSPSTRSCSSSPGRSQPSVDRRPAHRRHRRHRR